MKLDVLFSCISISGLIAILTCVYLLDVHMMYWLKPMVAINDIFIFPDTNRSHNCFKLYRNTTYFRHAIVYRASTNIGGDCRLISNAELSGRLGNNMFEIAAVIGLASKFDMLPVVNVKNTLIWKMFDLPNTVYSAIRDNDKCDEQAYGKYSDCLKTFHKSRSRNMMVNGYRQSWKYFNHAATYIRNVFSLKERLKQLAKSFIARNAVPGYDNVCIHVRRGDMLVPSNLEKGSASPGMEYISQAMQFFKRKYKKRVSFIVVSDDISWCRRNIIDKHVTFSPYNDPGIDIAIMRYCDHVIITSGTFGWWGAWLSKGTVVYYHDFPRNGSFYTNSLSYDDYYPPNWIKL